MKMNATAANKKKERGKTAPKLSHLIKLYRRMLKLNCVPSRLFPCDELESWCNSFGCNDIFQLVVALIARSFLSDFFSFFKFQFSFFSVALLTRCHIAVVL